MISATSLPASSWSVLDPVLQLWLQYQLHCNLIDLNAIQLTDLNLVMKPTHFTTAVPVEERGILTHIHEFHQVIFESVNFRIIPCEGNG